jgi:hypothetical protein
MSADGKFLRALRVAPVIAACFAAGLTTASFSFSTPYQAELRVWAGILGIVVSALYFFNRLKDAAAEDERSQARIHIAEEVAEREPERTKPAWDVARVTLEAYFRRNLRQIDMIFALSVLVMICGFAVMLWGVATSIQDSAHLASASLVTGAGIVTQMIGGTFLVVYKSAIQQAITNPAVDRVTH